MLICEATIIILMMQLNIGLYHSLQSLACGVYTKQVSINLYKHKVTTVTFL